MTENCHFKWKKNKLNSTAAPLIQHISPLQKHIRNPSHRTQYNSRAGRTNKASRGFSYTQSGTCARRRAVQKKRRRKQKTYTKTKEEKRRTPSLARSVWKKKGTKETKADESYYSLLQNAREVHAARCSL